MKLVASMIVKNEMDRYLPLAVSHLLTYVDEIRVLDDGSTDGTYEFLDGKSAVKVLRNEGPHFFEHEGQARQKLLDWTFEAQADYVLAIDADEFVGEPKILRAGIESSALPVYILQLVEAWQVNKGGISIRVDGLWGPRKVPMLYMPPDKAPPPSAARRRGSRIGTAAADARRAWRIADRQLACGREPQAVVAESRRAPVLGTHVFHFGWTRKSERQARAERYFEHDGGNFHQNRHLQSILWPDDKVGLKGLPWPEGLRPIAADLMAYSDR